MRVEEVHPLTMGQLSMWRDLAVRPPERLWESNMDVLWKAPPGATTEQVRHALSTLAQRHESLRTVYRTADDPHQVRQVVRPEPVVWFTQESVHEPFDLGRRPPWRVWVRTEAHSPQVHLTIHHIAADGAALQVLESDFHRLLRGQDPCGDLDAAPTPGALAARQRSSRFRTRLAVAADYVTRSLEDIPPTPAVSRGPLVRACAHAGIPSATVQRAARHHRVTVANLLLAAYVHTLAVTTGSDRHLLWTLAANRLDPTVRRLVSSMTQWVPISLTCAPDSPFEAAAQYVNGTALSSLAHGVYDPFAVPPLDFDRGVFFTFIPLSIGTDTDTAPSTMERPWVEWLSPRGYSGASFYLIARAHPRVQLTLRVMRAGYGRRHVEEFLTTMTGLLRRAVEESAMSEPA